MVVRGRRRRRRGVVAPFVVSTVLHRGSRAVCGMVVWCCRVARTCPACDHDSLISMCFVLF